MANIHQFPGPAPKSQMQCLGCGVISDAPCDCGVGFKAIIDELQEKDAAHRERKRQEKRRNREKAKQNQQSSRATGIRPKRRKAALSAEANDFIRELLEFTADYSDRIIAWHEANPDLDSEDKEALMRTIHQCADTVLGLAQAIDGR